MQSTGVFQFKPLLKPVRLVPVIIGADSIQPLRKRDCGGICVSDGGCCGFYENLSINIDAPCAACSREAGDG